MFSPLFEPSHPLFVVNLHGYCKSPHKLSSLITERTRVFVILSVSLSVNDVVSLNLVRALGNVEDMDSIWHISIQFVLFFVNILLYRSL